MLAKISARTVAVLALVWLLATTVGCGQKGDLYLPDESPEEQDFAAR